MQFIFVLRFQAGGEGGPVSTVSGGPDKLATKMQCSRYLDWGGDAAQDRADLRTRAHSKTRMAYIAGLELGRGGFGVAYLFSQI